MEQIGKFVDKLMGANETPSKPTDTHAQLLIEAGVQLLPGSPEFNVDTKLADLGEPRMLQQVLGNLNELFRKDFTLAEDILNNVTLGEMITHLDAAKVDLAIEKIRQHKHDEVVEATHTKLEDLRHSLDSNHE